MARRVSGSAPPPSKTDISSNRYAAPIPIKSLSPLPRAVATSSSRAGAKRPRFTAVQLAKGFEQTGVAEVVFVDLDRYNNPQEYSLAATIKMGEELGIPVISSGTITSLDDVATLRYLPNIGGCIIGRALFNGHGCFRGCA